MADRTKTAKPKPETVKVLAPLVFVFAAPAALPDPLLAFVAPLEPELVALAVEEAVVVGVVEDAGAPDRAVYSAEDW
jgi:hypothetical protein